MQTKFCDELRNHLDAYNEFTSIPTVMCEHVYSMARALSQAVKRQIRDLSRDQSALVFGKKSM